MRLALLVALLPSVGFAQWTNAAQSANACVKTGDDFVAVGLGEDVSYEKVTIAGTSSSSEALTILSGRIRMAPSTVNANALFYFSSADGFHLDSNVLVAAGGTTSTDYIAPRQSTLPVTVNGAHGVVLAPQASVDACVGGLKGQVTGLSSDGELYACDGTMSARLQRALWSASTAIDVGNLASHASETHTITVTGATTADLAVCRPLTEPTADIDAHEWISAADTVSIKFHNDSGGNVDPASINYQCTVFVK